MKILSHRGLWLPSLEKNTPTAFARSFHNGFGTETDIRDLAGRLVIAHDLPTEDALAAEVFFGIYNGIGDRTLPLALNVKADGLQNVLMAVLEKYSITNWFVFDMSVPDALCWLSTTKRVFTRHSEFEPVPAYYDRAAGVWLDGMTAQWWDADVIRRHLDGGKQVCVVSPELHGREPAVAWDILASKDLPSHPGLMLCTDRPEEAQKVLHG